MHGADEAGRASARGVRARCAHPPEAQVNGRERSDSGSIGRPVEQLLARTPVCPSSRSHAPTRPPQRQRQRGSPCGCGGSSTGHSITTNMACGSPRWLLTSRTASSAPSGKHEPAVPASGPDPAPQLPTACRTNDFGVTGQLTAGPRRSRAARTSAQRARRTTRGNLVNGRAIGNAATSCRAAENRRRRDLDVSLAMCTRR